MKKIVLILIAVILCVTLTGCKSVKGNEKFGKYTGIYKLQNMEIKVVHYKNKLLVKMNKNNEPFGSTEVIIEGNKFEDLNCTFEFKKDAVNIKTTQKDIPKGDYKRVKPYTTKEIYKDYVGDIAFLNNDYNGVFENDKNTIYTLQTTKDTIRFATDNNGVSTNLELNKKDEQHFYLDFFESKYNLTFNKEQLEVKYESPDEDAISGTYNRKSKMKAVDAIKIIAFDDYIK